jgi:tRNA modification GTPase
LYERKLSMGASTISAITTAVGPAAVGIVRLSGPQSLNIAREIFVPAAKKSLADFPPRTLVFGHVRDQGRDVDEVLAVYMPGPHSYTAEDVVEIQCHGGAVSLQKILALTYEHGAAPAAPGEFTKRAFLNGRLDLVQAEAVMDIINARSEVALKNSLRLQEGYLSRELEKIRQELLAVIVNLEAVIDYPEEDIEDVTYAKLKVSIANAREQVEKLAARGATGQILREGLRTVIVGRPNVGKSSLLNQLLKEDRALVSQYAGTTRDVIEEQLVVDGIPLVLADTAGIHKTEDFVEQLGIKRSRELLAKAELAIVVIDGTEALTPADEEILAAVQDKPYVLIVNKADLRHSGVTKMLQEKYPQATVLELSAKTGAGLDAFQSWLQKFVYGAQEHGGEALYVANARQENLLRQAAAALASAQDGAEQKLPYDCLSIDVNAALTDLGEITGQAASDEIINQIFARFCVGK